MTENSLATLISGVCHDIGKKKGIEFYPQATWGMQVPGRWEFDYQLRRQGRSTLILSYWFNMDMLLREEIILPWAYPPTAEQGEKFKGDTIAKIDQMMKWL
jgi:hypothetical protein